MKVSVVDERRCGVAEFPEPFKRAVAALDEHLQHYTDRLFIENGQRDDEKYDLSSYREMETAATAVVARAKAGALDLQLLEQGEASVVVLEAALTKLAQLRRDFLERGLVPGRMY